jgi:hypothetical protein
MEINRYAAADLEKIGTFSRAYHHFSSLCTHLAHILFFNTRPSAPTKSKCSSCCGSLFFLFAPLARSRSKRTNFQGDAPFELYTERRAKICFQREVHMHIHTQRAVKGRIGKERFSMRKLIGDARDLPAIISKLITHQGNCLLF